MQMNCYVNVHIYEDNLIVAVIKLHSESLWKLSIVAGKQIPHYKNLQSFILWYQYNSYGTQLAPKELTDNLKFFCAQHFGLLRPLSIVHARLQPARLQHW